MSAALSPLPAPQHWPCGPECQHARTMANTYGEWHWCAHPLVGGVVRDGKECRHFNALLSPPARAASARPWA